MKFDQTRLSNGLTIVAEVNEHAVSTGVGFFVRTGSRDETPEVSGVSHFLEHMAFKGTEHRSPDDINRLFDEMGAKYNAYTSEEHTVYHAAILPEYIEPCVDVLGDLLRPTLRFDDFETERGVILEEIGMYADSPTWSAFDKVTHNFFAGHPLGNSILGSKESVAALRLEAMIEYHQQRYSPSNIIAAASGRVDFEQFVELLEAKCGQWGSFETARPTVALGEPGPCEIIARSQFSLESIYWMCAAPEATSRLRFAADLLSVVIGDDTGSRFYWAMVDNGRVESIDMSYHEYDGAGAFLIGASCEPDLVESNLDCVRQILADVSSAGITEEELRVAKNKMLARLVLAAERPRNRIYPIAYNWIYRQDYRPIEAEMADVAAVTLDDVREMLDRFPLNRTTIVCLGPLEQVVGIGASGMA